MENTSDAEPDLPELPQEAYKRKASEPMNTPIAKRARTMIRTVPTLTLDKENLELAPMVIPPISQQQMLYMAEGMRVWTAGMKHVRAASIQK